MIRLLLGAEDLARIRVALGPDPFAETMYAAVLMRQRSPSPIFGWWRRSLRGQLGARVRPLAEMIPADRRSLDLSTLVGPVGSVREGVEAFVAARPEHLRNEIESLYQTCSRTQWPRMQLDSDLEQRRRVGSAICSFHAAAISPHWKQVGSFLQAERTCQVQRMTTVGIDRFLATLCPPLIQWRSPVLEIQSAAPETTELDLAGRGLVLAPSAYLSPFPELTKDPRAPDLAPALSYPVVRDLGTARQLWGCPRDGQPLAALLGRTRSAALEAIAEGCGTGELARRIGVSPAAASQHASVLRRSGLITTHRRGGTVMHAVTPLGEMLLDGES